MAIVNRVKRLFRADLHAILDSVEDPQSLLKQAIREMEEALDQKRLRLARTEQALHASEAASKRLQEKLEKVRSDLELSLREGSEELSRKTIARKLALEKQATLQQQQWEALQAASEKLAHEVKTQQEQYESIVEKAQLFVPAGAEDSPYAVAESILNAPTAAGSSPGLGVTDEEIELEWIRLQQSRKGGES